MFHVTERLLLRPAWPEDADALFGGIADEAIVRNLARAPWPYLPEHAREFVTRETDPRMPAFLMTLPGSKGSRVIGAVGLGEHEDGVELGYWIARPYWGLGFATEAARAVVGMARASGVRNIRAGHFADNPASGNVLRKLGFRFTGETQKRHSLGRNALVDCLIFEEGEGGGMNDDPMMDAYANDLPVAA